VDDALIDHSYYCIGLQRVCMAATLFLKMLLTKFISAALIGCKFSPLVIKVIVDCIRNCCEELRRVL
jgi:hypothetical protein